MKPCSLESVHGREMRLCLGLWASVLAAGLAGCNDVGPIEYSSSYGAGIKIDGLGSAYAWAPEGHEERAGTAELHEFVQAQVEQQLAEKGYALSPASEVVFLVNYRLSRRQVTDSTVVASGEVIEAGSLILELHDPKTRQLIWRGIARAKIEESDPPDVRKKRIETAVRGLMQRFPAKAV